MRKFLLKDCGRPAVKQMDERRIEELKYISSEVRKDVLRMVGMARSGPYETPLATASLLVYLYWEELVLIPAEPRRDDRDRFVLGMPEAVPALYAALARRGFFEREHLWHYRRLGAMLQAHPDFRRIPGMDAPCFTVQPSLSAAAALAGELSRRSFKPRVAFLVSENAFCSDEFAEEAARAAEEPIPNLFMIVVSKQNGVSGISACSGWDVRGAVADDFDSLESACASLDFSSGAPKALFVSARGGGIPRFGLEPEDGAHSLSLGELDQALEELEVRSDEHR